MSVKAAIQLIYDRCQEVIKYVDEGKELDMVKIDRLLLHLNNDTKYYFNERSLKPCPQVKDNK